ncbi:PA2778 family cysteine peptidase [Marinobacterium rhizophilum]|uniref:PA2778 family cysteine peptidase n=1 Tax=Marinobacterium rhizophilum TaxID=420402 RepID=A0ABY5HGL4_9GAMM|nr:PA2778 family cysteine peptidase [Marinobacterium rhizophilum]UTW10444.1 PA2778 family cysteine peptidase [Marinobacterium rhizophilum]
MLRPPPAVLLTAGILCLLLLGGCATRLGHDQLETLSDTLPISVELTEVPFYPQELYQCGPAALATVLNNDSPRTTPDALVPQIYIPERGGSLQIEMKVAARRHGMLAMEAPTSLQGLLAEVAAGRPVVVLQNLGLDIIPRWHYAVIVGYDLQAQNVILRSGTEQRRITPLGLFERTWARGDRWALLVLPPSQLPLQTEPLNVVRAALELEASDPQAALGSLHSASQRWPDDYLVSMALGNAELAAGHAKPASQAFRQALRQKAEAAEAWNNLAYSLNAEGCARQALQAVNCAVQLAPANSAFQDSLQELSVRPTATARNAQCTALPRCPASQN